MGWEFDILMPSLMCWGILMLNAVLVYEIVKSSKIFLALLPLSIGVLVLWTHVLIEGIAK